MGQRYFRECKQQNNVEDGGNCVFANREPSGVVEDAGVCGEARVEMWDKVGEVGV